MQEKYPIMPLYIKEDIFKVKKIKSKILIDIEQKYQNLIFSLKVRINI
jgi:hypothetical protein